MRLHLIQHGEICTLRLRPESGGWGFKPEVRTEVRLSFPRVEASALLACRGATVAVEAADVAGERLLRTLRETDPVRICWVAANAAPGRPPELTVQVHRFQRSFGLDPMEVGVDEQVVDRIAKLRKRRVSVREACEWLTSELTLDASVERQPRRVIATGSPDEGGRRFRLLGGRVAADVVPRDDCYFVERVVSLRADRNRYKPPQFVLECDVTFVDSTATGKMRHATRLQLDQIVASSDSYLALWSRYQAIEHASLVRRARDTGWLRYESFASLPSGLWRLVIADREALAGFHDSVRDAGAFQVEADADLPPELVDEEQTELESARTSRVAAGTIERVIPVRGEILVRPLDEDSGRFPPESGYLFPALQGDRTRLKRREDAVKRICSADARMRQLGLLIEGKATLLRRTDKVKPLSAAVRKAFEHEPTVQQKLAIDLALNTPDIVIIQGPPGTGKTTVLTAIQARLAELETKDNEIRGRTLLTSFQHDAVDHAAGMSRVLDLPPMRFGARRRRGGVPDHVRRWAEAQRDLVRANLSDLPEHRPLARYRDFRDRVASCAAGIRPIEEASSLVSELMALPVGELSARVRESLAAAADLLRGRGPVCSGGLERELQVAAARGLRTTAVAFGDDGPRKARQALRRLDGLLEESDRKLLESAAAAQEETEFTEYEELADLRDRVLDRARSDAIPGRPEGVHPDALDALNAVVDELGRRVRQGPSGVADALTEFADALDADVLGVQRALRDYSAVYAATCQHAVSHHVVDAKGMDRLDLEFENVIADEAARANPLDLFIPMSLASRRIILVGDHRQLPHLLEPDVEHELSTSAGEATREALRESLFQRLFEQLEASSIRDGVQRVITLDQQFRMHPVLGQFVSDTFYEAGEAFRSPRLPKVFAHELAGYQRAGRSVCAAWHDVPLAVEAEQRGRSKSRPAEARWIAAEVARLLREERAEVSIGVIAFYRAQVDTLEQALRNEEICEVDPDSGETQIRSEYRSLTRADGRREEQLRVGTVDSFQGKEFDVVFLSVVRSNALPGHDDEQLRRKFGHLLLPNRLCVAMSRQRQLLVVVGDRGMVESAEASAAVPGLARFLQLCGGEHGLVS